MSNDTITPDREAIDELLAVIATFSEITLSDRREAYEALLAELVTAAHEQAHRENEQRWAVGQAEGFGEEADVIRDLATTYRRHWRLAREFGYATAEGARHNTLASMAFRELMNDYDHHICGSQIDDTLRVMPIEREL